MEGGGWKEAGAGPQTDWFAVVQLLDSPSQADLDRQDKFGRFIPGCSVFSVFPTPNMVVNMPICPHPTACPLVLSSWCKLFLETSHLSGSSDMETPVSS